MLTSNEPGNVAFPATIPSSGVAEALVPVGNYTITYTAPSGHVLAEGEASTKETAVSEGATAEVVFSVVVVPQTGTLNINVTGLDSSATSGGSVSLQRTDIPDQGSQTVDIPPNGTISVTIVAGTYTATYTPPSGYALGAGVTNPQTGVVVPTDGSTSVSFAVTATGPDIYAWDFEGDTDTAASGLFITGGGLPFIANSAWERHREVSKSGIQSVRHNYPKTRFEIEQIIAGNPTTIIATGIGARWSGTTIVDIQGVQGNSPALNGQFTATKVDDNTITVPVNTTQAGTGGTVGAPSFGNTGTAFYYVISPGEKNVYVAWWERKEPGWSSLDIRKIFRFRGPSFQGPFGSFLEADSYSGRRYTFFWDHLNVTDVANVNSPAPAPADLIGDWHHFEVHRDATDPTQTVLEIWIDGTLYFNHVRDISGGSVPFQDSGRLEIHSIFNSMRQPSSLNVDRFAISRGRIGVH